MKDNTDLDAGTADRSEVEALFKGLQVFLRKEAQKKLPVLMSEDGGTARFRESSLERLYFAKPNAGAIPRGSIVLVPPSQGGAGS